MQLSGLRRFRRFLSLGILGMNRRNAGYISQYNPRRLYPLVDDKLQTKQLALQAGIAVPELYGVISAAHQVRDLTRLLAAHEDFVLKPAHGSGGAGIVVIAQRRNDRYWKVGGEVIGKGELAYHTSNILSGIYSLGGQSDHALIEYRVRFDPQFEAVTYHGVPDIRTVVFLGVPVMAMVRLPTRRSDGKANLHQGAVGVGVDLVTGTTGTGVCFDRVVEEHPDTGRPITGHQIPNWDRLLELATRCYELTGLGYLGVDIVLDRDRGPLVLELNARPGISIQIANGEGLVPRLEAVERRAGSLLSGTWSIAERIRFAKECFDTKH